MNLPIVWNSDAAYKKLFNKNKTDSLHLYLLIMEASIRFSHPFFIFVTVSIKVAGDIIKKEVILFDFFKILV